MATKINPDFYGAENTFVNNSGTTYAKHSTYSLGDLMSSGKYTGGSLDTSAAPWGIGKSSMSSEYWMFLTKGAEWTYNHGENQRKNSPLYLYFQTSWVLGSGTPAQFVGADANAYNYTSGCYKNRVYPAVKYDSGRFKSSLDIDYNDTISLTNSETVCPITYADYQHLRAFVDTIVYIPTSGSSLQTTTLPNLLNGTTTNIKKIVRINWGIRDTDNNYTSINFSVGGAESDIPELFRQCYYGDETKWVRPCRFIDVIGLWSDDWYVFNTNDCASTSSFEEVTASNPVFPYVRTTAWGTASDTEQAFDDITYKWVYGFCKNNNASIQDWTTPIETGEIYDATSLYGGVVYLDCGEDATPQDYGKAILHEMAFLGFPFIKQNSDYNKPIGHDDVYLPVFDDHMITTGNYIAGSDSLTLPNSTWGDIFDSEMPEYDPTYDPEPPTPPDPDEDYGYLNNKPVTNRVYSSNNRVYALTAAQYSQFINDINSLYLDDPDTGYASFQLDFKGTNPSDYIVGTYGYTFLPAGLIPNQTPEAIQIGAVTLPNAEGYKIAPSYIYNARILGAIDLTGAGDYKPFGDFRDFEPYTHIELYIPLCGNIELDPAAVVGHTIQIEIIFDIMTGNATACVYRDNQTLIATVAGQLAASLPLTSGRMGDYQNAVKSAENALKQNELKTTTAAATVAMGVGAALLAPETGGLSLAAYGAAITGGASLMSLSNQQNQIEYEIKHKQPSISVCSSANGAVAQNISSMYAVCYVKQCKMLSSYNAATYAHTVGHATVKNTTIGAETTDDSNSLIVCSNADLSGIPATAAEINAIQSLLTGGVYV